MVFHVGTGGYASLTTGYLRFALRGSGISNNDELLGCLTASGKFATGDLRSRAFLVLPNAGLPRLMEHVNRLRLCGSK
jgi:hypothetical protein